jgi:hypothetical protein
MESWGPFGRESELLFNGTHMVPDICLLTSLSSGFHRPAVTRGSLLDQA